MTANHSFYRTFNLEADSHIHLNDEIFRGLGDKMQAYRQIMQRMHISEHWHGVDTIQLSELRAREVLVNH